MQQLTYHRCLCDTGWAKDAAENTNNDNDDKDSNDDDNREGHAVAEIRAATIGLPYASVGQPKQRLRQYYDVHCFLMHFR